MLETRLETVACAVCGDAEAQRVADPRSLYSEARFSVMRCRRCGLVYVSPRSRSFEAGYETNEAAVQYFIDRAPRDLEPHSRFHSIARQIAQRRPRARVLDIGSGIGTFLDVVHAYGLQGTGLEISRSCVAYGRERHSRRLVQGNLERTSELEAAAFDAATLIQTLEHVANPVAMLQAVRRYLAPGGLLFVDVPNYDFVLSRFERMIHTNVTRHWDPTAHLYYFTTRTLALVAEAAGYRPLHTSTPAPWVVHRVLPERVARQADALFALGNSGHVIQMFAAV